MYKVLIRPLEIRDARVSWQWRNNALIWELTGAKPSGIVTYEIEKTWIEKVLLDETARRFAIIVDDVYVGNIQLTNIIENETAEYHVFIGNTDYWNKGVAFLATKQIIRFASNVLKLKRIYLKVNPKHEKAIKLYEKCNFKKVTDDIKMDLYLVDAIKPIVSVFVMVYNHEIFLNETLQSLLMQKCNFDFEIVVGEDCSTDKSRDILVEYQHKFPGKFKLLLNKKNIGANQNQIQVFDNCQGEYIAICEGDDYWIDPLKLQKQVGFLEANPAYVIHSGSAIQLSDNYNLNGKTLFNSNCDTSYELEAFLSNNNLISCTVLFRNINFKLPTDFTKATFGDWFLYVILMKNTGGKAYRSIDVFSVYRIHSGGIMSNLSKLNYCKTHICQILTIHKYLKINKMNQKTIDSLSSYFLPKFRIEVQGKSFCNCIETVISNFKIASWSMPLRKYLSVLKQEFLSN